MKNKKIIASLSIVLLSAGCSLFGGGPAAAGVFKSVNGGADWLASNAIKGNRNATLAGSNISKLAFDPQNHEVVYAGSYTDGLYKSEDSGANWTRILSKILVYDFVVHPADSKMIYVSGVFDGQGKVLKTSDGGASWQEIYNEAVAANPVRAIDLNSASPNQILIGTASGNIIKSPDAGLSWQLTANFPDSQVNKIFWRNSGVYVLLRNKGLYRGSPAADNFQNITDKIARSGENSFVNNSLSFNQAYVDPVAANLIYITTNQGLYKSVDSGASWVKLALPAKQDETKVQPVVVAPTSSNVVFTSVGPVIYKSTNGGSTWQTQRVATNGYINYILVDPQLPQIVYAGAYVAQ